MDVKSIFKKFIQNTGFSGTCRFDEEIAPLTTFRIGGTAAVFVAPDDSFQIQDVFFLVKKYNIPYFVLGGGSNVVFRDGYFEGLVISTENIRGISCTDFDFSCEDADAQSQTFGSATALNEKSERHMLVGCAAGMKMQEFVDYCVQNDLWGAEKFAGLPGSVGGAIFMNARCFEKSICENLEGVFAYDFDKMEGVKIPYRAEDWAYKKSPFQCGGKLILQASFRLEKRPASEHQKLEDEARHYIEQRKSRGHFDFPSAGSVFKNNRSFGSPSGKLIDDAGLKGFRIGNAQVAKFHGNFIINLGGATQKDVRNLVEYVVNTVEEKKGFKLEPEILFF